MVLSLLMKLVFIPSTEKSDIVSSQDFVSLGYWFRTDLGIVLLSSDQGSRRRGYFGSHYVDFSSSLGYSTAWQM